MKIERPSPIRYAVCMSDTILFAPLGNVSRRGGERIVYRCSQKLNGPPRSTREIQKIGADTFDSYIARENSKKIYTRANIGFRRPPLSKFSHSKTHTLANEIENIPAHSAYTLMYVSGGYFHGTRKVYTIRSLKQRGSKRLSEYRKTLYDRTEGCEGRMLWQCISFSSLRIFV